MLEKPRQQKHKPQGLDSSKPRISERAQRQQEPPPQECRNPTSFLSTSRPSSPSTSSDAAGNGGNVDRVLFKNLVEMVPLVETLMVRRASSTFTRRASMIYTPAPSQPKKTVDTKGRKNAYSARKQRELGENVLDKHVNKDNEDNDGAEFSVVSARPLTVEHAQKDTEELNMLREQVDDLQKKLVEKDEDLKAAKNSLTSVYGALDELKRQVTEKDSVVKSAHSQLNNAKINLADKQSALERLDWEAREANNKVELLQRSLESVDFEVTSFMKFFEQLSKCDSTSSFDETVSYVNHLDNLPIIDVDEIAMEEARVAYLEAIDAAKENPTDESLAFAAEARLRLQAFVL